LTPRGKFTADDTPQDPAAALALVSARGADDKPAPPSDAEQDPELKRAKDLIELHYSIKIASENGQLERILREARAVVRELDTGGQ
jgi:hypothetical protein